MRTHWGRLIAALSRQFRDIELAEDALQDALTSALTAWPKQGVPKNTNGWLYQTAKRKAIDRLRRVGTRQAKADSLLYETELASMDNDDEAEIQTGQDERLGLIFACCHPALPAPAHTALTLKTVCGLTTAQIAAAYLITENSMAQRIVRAKRKIKQAGIPFAVPGPELWPDRWKSVLAVIYLIYNEGYSRIYSEADLGDEAVRLSRILVKLLPHEPEASGLLALMLFGQARRPARMENPEIFISLEDQNRELWEKGRIKEAHDVLVKALSKGEVGPYQLQATISAVHCQATTFEDTDWQEISVLYERLYSFEPTPIVLLNASVALSYAQSPTAGLASLQLITHGGSLEDYQPYHAAQADMLNRDGQHSAAKIAYEKAIALSTSKQDTAFLKSKLVNLGHR